MEDTINAGFESAACFFVGLHVRRVLIDKSVAGVSWLAITFFTVWGFWNLFYYPALGQPYSFAASVVLCFMNLLYLTLVIRRVQNANTDL